MILLGPLVQRGNFPHPPFSLVGCQLSPSLTGVGWGIVHPVWAQGGTWHQPTMGDLRSSAGDLLCQVMSSKSCHWCKGEFHPPTPLCSPVPAQPWAGGIAPHAPTGVGLSQHQTVRRGARGKFSLCIGSRARGNPHSCMETWAGTRLEGLLLPPPVCQ